MESQDSALPEYLTQAANIAQVGITGSLLSALLYSFSAIVPMDNTDQYAIVLGIISLLLAPTYDVLRQQILEGVHITLSLTAATITFQCSVLLYFFFIRPANLTSPMDGLWIGVSVAVFGKLWWMMMRPLRIAHRATRQP